VNIEAAVPLAAEIFYEVALDAVAAELDAYSWRGRVIFVQIFVQIFDEVQTRSRARPPPLAPTSEDVLGLAEIEPAPRLLRRIYNLVIDY